MKKWFSGLQALRGLAFLMVYVSHSYQFCNYFGDWGAIGVEIFFVLSGFLGGYFFNEQRTLETGVVKSCFLQFWKKIKDFWPLYVVFVFVACISHWSGIRNLLLNVFLLQSYTGSASIALTYNWPTWFLSSIMLSYLLSPIMNLAVNKVSKNTLVVTFLMVAVLAVQTLWAYHFRAYIKAYDKGYYFVYLFPCARVADYLQGVLASKIVKKIEDKPLKRATIIEAFAILCFVIECIVYQGIPKIYRYSSCYVVASVFLIIVFAIEKGKITQTLAKNKVLSWIGYMSFELYIIHRMIIYHTANVSTSVIAWILCSAVIVLLAVIAKETKDLIHCYHSNKLNK